MFSRRFFILVAVRCRNMTGQRAEMGEFFKSPVQSVEQVPADMLLIFTKIQRKLFCSFSMEYYGKYL